MNSNVMHILNSFTMMLAPLENYALFKTVRLVILSLIVVCSVFLIIVILMQPGNSSGVSAISGETETYLGRNKGKTKEGILKTLTIIAIVALVVLSISFFLINILWK